MFVAVFAVAGWVRSRISVAPFAVPTTERLSEFLKDSLTRLRMQVIIAFVILEVRGEVGVVWNMTDEYAGRVAQLIR